MKEQQQAAPVPASSGAPPSPPQPAAGPKPKATWIDKLGGRKFVFAFAAMVMAFILVLTGHFTSEQLAEAVKWIVAAFAGGNGLEHVGKGLGNKGGA